MKNFSVEPLMIALLATTRSLIIEFQLPEEANFSTGTERA